MPFVLVKLGAIWPASEPVLEVVFTAVFFFFFLLLGKLALSQMRRECLPLPARAPPSAQRREIKLSNVLRLIFFFLLLSSFGILEEHQEAIPWEEIRWGM